MSDTAARLPADQLAAQLGVVRSAWTILWRAVFVVFAANMVEEILMWRIHTTSLPLSVFIDGVLLAIICLPMLYIAILKPVSKLAAEQAAAGAEARFQTIAQAVNDGILIFNTARKIAFANLAVEQMHGYPRGALRGKSVDILVPKESQERFQAAMTQRLDTSGVAIIGSGPAELEGLRKSGERFPTELAVNALPEGQTLWLVAIVRDITTRKQAEAALRESEALFRSLADTAPVMIWTSGPTGDCTFFNKQWLDFRGRILEQELGHGWSEGIHPEDQERCLRVYQESIAARQSYEIEYRLRRADGEYRWILERATPRYLPDGGFAGNVGSSLDVTVRKRSEEALRASEKRFRELLEALPVAVRIVQQGKLVFANAADARLYGFNTADEELALDPSTQVATEEQPRLMEYARRRAAGEYAPSRYEVRMRRRDGAEFPAEVEVKRIFYEEAPASLIAIRDLTESKRIEVYEKLLPVCCVCGKIRDDSGSERGAGAWERLDQYLARHSDTQFSHTFCPDCFEDYRKENLGR